MEKSMLKLQNRIFLSRNLDLQQVADALADAAMPGDADGDAELDYAEFEYQLKQPLKKKHALKIRIQRLRFGQNLACYIFLQPKS